MTVTDGVSCPLDCEDHTSQKATSQRESNRENKLPPPRRRPLNDLAAGPCENDRR